MYKPPIQKLSANDFIRPTKTITDLMQNKKDIEAKLEGYEEVDEGDVNFITLGTHLRYLSWDKANKKELFRFGGLITKIARDYVILQGKEAKSFSVQRYTLNDKGDILHKTRFFKKVKKEEQLQRDLNETVEETADIMQKQSAMIEKQKKELHELKKRLNKLEK
jgi:hypothetical protein